MKLSLDTSAYSALMRGHRAVTLAVRRSDEVQISPVVAGELFYGFRHGQRFERNAARLETFLADPFVVMPRIGRATADRFGRIAAALRAKGTPIPSNDIWIAAQAMETGADLLSADRHFAAVAGLAWVPFSLSDEETVRERTLEYYASSTG